MAVTGTIRSSAAQSSEGARERFTTRRVEASTPRLTVVPYMEGVRRRPIWNEQLSPPPLLGSPVGAAAGARRARGHSLRRQRGTRVGRHGRRLSRARPLDRRGARAKAHPARRSRALHVAAFEREYQVLAGLDHPRIIRVFDYGVDEVGPYYTMELLEGQDMRKSAPLPYREACLHLRDVATSLSLLHARRLIHRDLSPANVRMTPDGHCKLLDFGALASFGSSRLVVGTPPAIPPEALGGAPLDQRADLYSLGALAYWMLTGRHAYPARHIEELSALWKWTRAAERGRRRHPKELDALVLSLLSSNPSRARRAPRRSSRG